MKTFKESVRPQQIAQELTTFDNETIARIFASVLDTRKDSVILKGVGEKLKTRLEILDKEKNTSDPNQAELF